MALLAVKAIYSLVENLYRYFPTRSVLHSKKQKCWSNTHLIRRLIFSRLLWRCQWPSLWWLRILLWYQVGWIHSADLYYWPPHRAEDFNGIINKLKKNRDLLTKFNNKPKKKNQIPLRRVNLPMAQRRNTVAFQLEWVPCTGRRPHPGPDWWHTEPAAERLRKRRRRFAEGTVAVATIEFVATAVGLAAASPNCSGCSDSANGTIAVDETEEAEKIGN